MKDSSGIDLSAIGKIEEYEKLHMLEQPSSNRPLPVRVEDAFDQFVTEFGGKKISDIIDTKSKMPINADYIFDKYNVIAELKTLEGIFSGIDGSKAVIQTFIDSGHSRDEAFSVLIGLTEMPPKVKELILRRIRRSIEQRIKKARQQLRMSKSSFGNKDTRCLIIFAVDQPPLFGQRNVLLILSKLMADNYFDQHIDGVIYINPNVPTRVNPEGMEFGGWFPFYRDDNTNDDLSDFVDLLGNRWLTFHGNKTGNTNPILELKTPDDMITVLSGETIITPDILKKRS